MLQVRESSLWSLSLSVTKFCTEEDREKESNQRKDSSYSRTISADYGYFVRIDFRDFFRIEPASNEGNCDYDYLEVRINLLYYQSLLFHLSFPLDCTKNISTLVLFSIQPVSSKILI